MTQAWDFPRIMDLAGQIRASVGTVHKELEEGEAELRKLGDVWGGSGSEAFNGIMAKWQTTSTEVNEKLGTLSGKIDEAVQSMQQTESNVAARFA